MTPELLDVAFAVSPIVDGSHCVVPAPPSAYQNQAPPVCDPNAIGIPFRYQSLGLLRYQSLGLLPSVLVPIISSTHSDSFTVKGHGAVKGHAVLSTDHLLTTLAGGSQGCGNVQIELMWVWSRWDFVEDEGDRLRQIDHGTFQVATPGVPSVLSQFGDLLDALTDVLDVEAILLVGLGGDRFIASGSGRGGGTSISSISIVGQLLLCDVHDLLISPLSACIDGKGPGIVGNQGSEGHDLRDASGLSDDGGRLALVGCVLAVVGGRARVLLLFQWVVFAIGDWVADPSSPLVSIGILGSDTSNESLVGRITGIGGYGGIARSSARVVAVAVACVSSCSGVGSWCVAFARVAGGSVASVGTLSCS